jgi:hypothetical protein
VQEEQENEDDGSDGLGLGPGGASQEEFAAQTRKNMVTQSDPHTIVHQSQDDQLRASQVQVRAESRTIDKLSDDEHEEVIAKDLIDESNLNHADIASSPLETPPAPRLGGAGSAMRNTAGAAGQGFYNPNNANSNSNKRQATKK